MVNFYVAKIRGGAINPNTDKPWTLEDVPKLWRGKVEWELMR